ncbi:MAG: hypothetical protein CMP10_08120 [Zetaproteobacteria bacterium]|nr:hypothetical protein [Pseudobdellovibrionaceae bacterium]|tara:strand:- start:69 stop:1292 length:1224 start_codon:yes stop_codon:yes gene_type:complete
MIWLDHKNHKQSVILIIKWLILAKLAFLVATDLTANTIKLGQSFSSYDQSLKEPCLVGDSVFINNSFQEFGYTISSTIAQHFEQTTGFLSVGVNLFLIGASYSLEYLSKTLRTERSLTILFNYSTKAGSLIYKNRKLNQRGELASSQSAQKRKELCGEAFASQQSLGSRLFINATLHFKDKASLERFIHTIKISFLFGLITKTSRFKEETKTFTEDAYLTVDGYQEGGQDSDFNNLLQEIKQGPCHIKNPEKCIKGVNRLLQYAITPSGYRQQIALNNPPLLEELDNLSVLETELAAYHESGHEALQSFSDPIVINSAQFKPSILMIYIDKLASLYQVKERILFLLDADLSQSDRPKLKSGLDEINDRIEQLKKLVEICKASIDHQKCRKPISNLNQPLAVEHLLSF